MSNKTKYIVCGLIAVLLVCTVLSILYMNSRYDIVDDMTTVKHRAIALYEQGDVDMAIAQMEAYCNHVMTDVEAKITLGDWYMDKGDEESAYSHYYEAANNKPPTDDRITALTVKNAEEILLEPVTKVSFQITPDVRVTKDMTLIITGHNLVPDKIFEGQITGYEAWLTEDSDYYTTDWFNVDPAGEYLTMSGGFNCAIWQFKNINGEIIAVAESNNSYRANNTYGVDVYQMARVVIPDEASGCRVTYFDRKNASVTAALEEELTIVYGRLPGESRKSDFSYYEIPDLIEGEKIVFENNEWKMVSGDVVTPLTDWALPIIERGSHFSIGGTLPGRVSFENCEYADYSKEGIYTIRFDSYNPSAAGERMDDAKNLGFNAAVGEGKIALGENHFDNIYPWKDMKLCNIKDGEVVAYEGEAGFSSNGSMGDVFVEIPKFYVKRVVDTVYDTISISGVKHEGFEVDEAFVTKNGEADKIYVAAYLTSVNEDGAFESISDANPVLNLSARALGQRTQEKGEGYKEIDYAALSALQKLFMVETGIRNSQYLFMGVCAYSIASNNPENMSCAVALTDSDKSNCIVVEPGYNFVEGNSIIIFNSGDYHGSIDGALSDVRRISTVISNEDGTQSVYFTGEPLTITANVSAVAHVALANGSTRSVRGHTGAISTARGTVAFKYRGVENLWGNAYVYIDGITVKNGNAVLTDRKGTTKQLAYTLPVSDSANPIDCMVRRVGFDPSNPQVMLPCQVGEGATISTYYGDAYINGNDPDKEYVIHYGGGWDARASAGLFSFVASASIDDEYNNTAGRMIFVK